MKEIARGAEAVIYEKDGVIIKHRLRQSYRLKQIDDLLRKQHPKREAYLLKKLRISHPKLISSDDKEKIIMEKIKGVKLRDVLDKEPILAKRVGSLVAEMHEQNIIHGDLTTSNMIVRNKNEIVFIDFGLSFHSHKLEDMAVDVHLFKQALESKHHVVFDFAMEAFFEGYKNFKKYKDVLERLKSVEKRGRNKKK